MCFQQKNMSFDFWYIIIEIWLKISEENWFGRSAFKSSIDLWFSIHIQK